MKFYIGIPCYNRQLHTDVATDLLLLHSEMFKNKHQMIVDFPSSPFIALNRNRIVEHALKEQADYILMWDNDIHVSTQNFVNLMLETAYKHDASIVGLAVRLKTPEKVIYAMANKIADLYVNLERLEAMPFEVDVIGAGVMLIKTSVFGKLRPPYFSMIDTKTGVFPEDWNFCEKVKEKRGKIICEPRVGTVHYGLNGWAHGFKD